MTPEQASEFAAYLTQHRERAGVAMYSLAQDIGVDRAQLTRLEQGKVLNPRPEVLAAYAKALGVPLADIYSTAGIPLPKELPTLRPYLRARYRELTADDAAKVEAFVQGLMQQHSNNGPKPGEDEA